MSKKKIKKVARKTTKRVLDTWASGVQQSLKLIQRDLRELHAKMERWIEESKLRAEMQRSKTAEQIHEALGDIKQRVAQIETKVDIDTRLNYRNRSS